MESGEGEQAVGALSAFWSLSTDGCGSLPTHTHKQIQWDLLQDQGSEENCLLSVAFKYLLSTYCVPGPELDAELILSLKI